MERPCNAVYGCTVYVTSLGELHSSFPEDMRELANRTA